MGLLVTMTDAPHDLLAVDIDQDGATIGDVADALAQVARAAPARAVLDRYTTVHDVLPEPHRQRSAFRGSSQPRPALTVGWSTIFGPLLVQVGDFEGDVGAIEGELVVGSVQGVHPQIARSPMPDNEGLVRVGTDHQVVLQGRDA